jgi:hypothetical protein
MAKNRYQVVFYRPERYSPACVGTVLKAYKNERSAIAHAERVNARHCRTTRTGRNPRAWVEVFRVGLGTTYVCTPVIVPSVGEIGYW